MGVFAITERVGFPRVRKPVCVTGRISVESWLDRTVTGDVRVEARGLVGGFRAGARALELGGGAVAHVTTPVTGIVGQSRAVGTWGAALILGDRSPTEGLIGASLVSSAEAVGRVAMMDCTVASWVMTV